MAMNQKNAFFGTVLHFLRALRDVEEKEVALIKYGEVTPPFDKGDHTFGNVVVRCSNCNELDYTVTKDISSEDVTKGGGWYGVEPLECLMDTAYFVRPNPAVHPFTGCFRELIFQGMSVYSTKIAKQEQAEVI